MAKIVFIEDEPNLQKTLATFLIAQGYEVFAELDGEAGLAAVRREHPDLVLLDLILPRKHGLEVLEDIRKDPAIAAIPVIIITNMESSDAVERAVELGAKAYLVKTNYALEEVLAKIKNVLDRR